MRKTIWTLIMCTILAASFSGSTKPKVITKTVYKRDTIWVVDTIRDTIIDSIHVQIKQKQKKKYSKQFYLKDIDRISLLYDLPPSIIAGIAFQETTWGINTSTGNHTGINVNSTGTYYGMFSINPKYASEKFRVGWKNHKVQIEECARLLKKEYDYYLEKGEDPKSSLMLSLSCFYRGRPGVDFFLSKSTKYSLYKEYANKIVGHATDYDFEELFSSGIKLETWVENQKNQSVALTK